MPLSRSAAPRHALVSRLALPLLLATLPWVPRQGLAQSTSTSTGPGPAQGPAPAAAPGKAPAPPPDLSRLPVVDDDVGPRVPTGYAPPQPTVTPYLGQMLSEPAVDFVPAEPATGLNPRAVWDGLLVPPAPTPEEMAARRLRATGLALLVAGAVGAVVSVAVLASQPESPVGQGLGYSSLTLSVLAAGGGGALFGVGDLRWKRARRTAAGLLP